MNEGQVMTTSQPPSQLQAGYELRFRSLFNARRGFSFPCDASGHVDIETLNERARNNYFFARSVIGRELATPEVQPRFCHHMEHLQ
jgi:hypothetical protein